MVNFLEKKTQMKSTVISFVSMATCCFWSMKLSNIDGIENVHVFDGFKFSNILNNN